MISNQDTATAELSADSEVLAPRADPESQARSQWLFTPFLFFFVVSAVTFSACQLGLRRLDLHLASLVSQALALTFLWLLSAPLRSGEPSTGSAVSSAREEPADYWSNLAEMVVRPLRPLRRALHFELWKEAWTIVLVNGLLGILLVHWLIARIDFTEMSAASIPLHRLFLFGGVLNVLTVQVGGWPLQAFLVFCLVTLLNGHGSLKYYLQVVGLSYVGFLLLTLTLAVLDPLYFPATVELSAVDEIVGSLHAIMGKTAEYWVLTLVAYAIFVRERFSAFKSVAISMAPSFLLLAMKLLYDRLL
jgi:hypothetical protein